MKLLLLFFFVVCFQGCNRAKLKLSSASIVDSAPPVPVSASLPNATYSTGDFMDVTVAFNELVTVSGSPQLQLSIGGTPVTATYVSGSGTNNLVFRYTVVSGVSGTGVDVLTPIDLNGGTIQDASLNDAVLSFSSVSEPTIQVDGSLPGINSVSLPNQNYMLSDDMDVTVVFSETVNVAGGTPSLDLDINGTIVSASYVSGTGSSNLVFRYTVASPITSATGVTIKSPVLLNGSTIKNNSSVDSELTFTDVSYASMSVDATAPSITSASLPAGPYVVGSQMNVTVAYDEIVTVSGTPNLLINFGGTDYTASYVSGSGSSNIVFRYTLAAGLSATGVTVKSPINLNSGTMKDGVGNNADLTFTDAAYPAYVVDSSAPAISSVTLPAGPYTVSDNMDVTVAYDQNVTVSGTPSLVLSIGGTDYTASYVSGTGSSNIVFRYTVASGVTGSGVVVKSPISLNSGTMKDANDNDAELTFTNVNYPSTDVISSAAITTVTLADQFYQVGDNMDVNVTWDSSVTVTGSPTLVINMGGSDYTATYNSGSGSATLVFRYTVQNTVPSLQGVTVKSPISLAGGTITNSGASSGLTFTDASYSSMYVDGTPNTAPVITQSDIVFVNGYAQSFFASYTDPDFSDDHDFSATGLGGSNITLDPDTGKFTIPANAVAGTYSVGLTIDDNRGGTDTVNFSIKVEALGGSYSKVASPANCNNTYSIASGGMCGYYLYTPTAYTNNPTANMCVIFYLHGAAENGTGSSGDLDLFNSSGTSATQGSPIYLGLNHSKHWPCLVIAPQQDHAFASTEVQMFIKQLRRQYRFDENRMYLWGVSNGGAGVMVSIHDFGSIFAAAISENAASAVASPTTGQKYNAGIPSSWHWHTWDDNDAFLRRSQTVTSIDALMASWFSISTGVGTDYNNTDFYGEYDHSVQKWVWYNTSTPLVYDRRFTMYSTGNHTGNIYKGMSSAVGQDFTFGKSLDKGIRNKSLKPIPHLIPNTSNQSVVLQGYFRDLDGEIDSVYVDATEVGLDKHVALTKEANGIYKTTLSIASGLSLGNKLLKVYAIDSDGNAKRHNVVLTVNNNTYASGATVDYLRMNIGSDSGTCAATGFTGIFFGAGSVWEQGYLDSTSKGRIVDTQINLVNAGTDSRAMFMLDFYSYSDTALGDSNVERIFSGGYTTGTVSPFTTSAAKCHFYTRKVSGHTDINNVKVKIINLNPGFKYNVKTLHTYAASGTMTNYTKVNGTTQNLNAVNQANHLTFNNVTLEDDNSVSIEIWGQGTGGSDYAFLNAIQIEMVQP